MTDQPISREDVEYLAGFIDSGTYLASDTMLLLLKLGTNMARVLLAQDDALKHIEQHIEQDCLSCTCPVIVETARAAMLPSSEEA